MDNIKVWEVERVMLGSEVIPYPQDSTHYNLDNIVFYTSSAYSGREHWIILLLSFSRVFIIMRNGVEVGLTYYICAVQMSNGINLQSGICWKDGFPIS